MEDQTLEQKIKKAAVPSGLIYGIVSLVMAIAAFYYIVGVASSLVGLTVVPFILSVIVPIAAAVFLTLDLRKKIGGYWNFRQAVTGIFIMFFVGFWVSYLGRDFLFAKLIEPDMVTKTENAFIAPMTKMMEKSGADQDKIDQQLDKFKQNFESQKVVTVGSVVKNVTIAIILTFVFSLIFAAIFKKEPPLFDVPIEEETT